MAGYDTGSLTLSSMTVAPNDILRLTAPNNGQQTLGGGMDAFDHDLNFEGEGLLYATCSTYTHSQSLFQQDYYPRRIAKADQQLQ